MKMLRITKSMELRYRLCQIHPREGDYLLRESTGEVFVLSEKINSSVIRECDKEWNRRNPEFYHRLLEL